jgi:hypothetical protein
VRKILCRIRAVSLQTFTGMPSFTLNRTERMTFCVSSKSQWSRSNVYVLLNILGRLFADTRRPIDMSRVDRTILDTLVWPIFKCSCYHCGMRQHVAPLNPAQPRSISSALHQLIHLCPVFGREYHYALRVLKMAHSQPEVDDLCMPVEYIDHLLDRYQLLDPPDRNDIVITKSL